MGWTRRPQRGDLRLVIITLFAMLRRVGVVGSMSIIAVLVVVLALVVVVIGIRVPLLMMAVAIIVILMGRIPRHVGLNVWSEERG